MIRHIRAKAVVAFVLISLFAFPSVLRAAPMTYTGIVVTDVRVGTTFLHNASLTITFEGDTNNIVPAPVSSYFCANPSFYYLPTGVARIQIEYQGRTRTATLNEGQIAVVLDTCNGGIGFGSFTGPNGFEPAYPLGLTLGTAEYAAVTYGSPLNSPLAVTGAAWSCIGYPPLQVGNLNGTASGNCIPPDGDPPYPLKSDIGNIFIYQPYEEEFLGEVFSNHSGSTNRGAFLVSSTTTAPVPAVVASGTSESDDATRVVYTLETVADGWIGNHAFAEALVTLRMVSNPKSVTTQPSPADANKSLYENKAGVATVTIDDGTEVITAEFEQGEVYVRYDTGIGVAGFGSPISPTYPVALNCANGAYPSDTTYTVDCLQGEAWDYLNLNDSTEIFHGGTLAQLNYPVGPSPAVTALPQSLSQNTLLTGTAHTCAGVYTVGPPAPYQYYFPGDLLICGGPAPRGLHTNKGDLYLQDLVGGSLSMGNLAPNGAGSDPGWDEANSGFLHVEVYKNDE